MRRAVSLPLMILLAGPLLAGMALSREPTPDESARIEAALRTAGYVTWGAVEMREESDRIRVTAARRTTDGPSFDVTVEPTTMRVTENVPN